MKRFIFLFSMLTVFVMSVIAANYEVVGASLVCNGQDWNNDAAVNLMTTSDDGATYSLTITGLTLESGTPYEYKIVEKGSWDEYYPKTGSNATFTVPETAVYTIKYVYTVSTSQCEVQKTKTGNAGEVTHTYTVAGNSTVLFGNNTWDASNTDNDMTLANGVYTWSKSNVLLSAGSFQFKCVRDHAWGVTYGGDGPDGNYVANVPEDGTYDVVITLDATSFAVNCTLTKTGSAVITHTYTVAGAPASIFGDEWTPSLADNDMTLDNGVYTWTGTGHLSAGTTVAFKVVKDHAWGTEWPAQNYTINVETSGTYTLTVTFNATTEEVSGVLTLTHADEPRTATVYFQSPGWDTVNYYAWDGNDTRLLGDWPGTAITATTVVNGDTYYYREFTLQDDSYSFNVIFNNGSGTQTHNIEGITGDVYYKLGALRDGQYDVVDLGDPTVSGVTLAQALAGTAASTDVISDELTVVCVHGGKVYATDGNGGWVRLDGVSNASQMRSGYVIDSYQVSASVSQPRQDPSVAVNDALRSAEGGNVPALRDIYLSKAYAIDNAANSAAVYPTPGEVVTIRGFFFYNGDVPCMYAYSGERGSRGIYLMLDGNAGMTEGRPYAIDVAISLAEPWSAPSGAPRRVSPSDSNAYTNLRGAVVGDPYVETGVADVSVEREVAGVKYVSLDGRTGDRPFDGVNIVVTTYADGSVSAVKVLR